MNERGRNNLNYEDSDPRLDISSSNTSLMLRIGSPLITFWTSSEFKVSCSTRARASWEDAKLKVKSGSMQITYFMQLVYFRGKKGYCP